MTMTVDQYIASVLENMPSATPRRRQIELELHSLIAERVERGQPLADVLGQLGNPQTLAESYLAEVPLVAASFWSRAAAKIIDVIVVVGVVGLALVPVGWAVMRFVDVPAVLFVVVGCFIAVFGFGIYTAVTEWQFGATAGKRLLALGVVRESGGRISFGQAVVRQLPQWLQVFWIDVMFALFTERNQRAFELLSKTRVVQSTDNATRS